MMTRPRRFFSGLVLGACLLVPAAGDAMEPGNDTGPWQGSSGKDLTFYDNRDAAAGLFQGYEKIASSSDVDFLVVSCGGRTVTAAEIYLEPGTGDLDINVYDLLGNLLGRSAGTSNREHVDVRAFGKQTIVIQAYGYRGATGLYGPNIFCN